MLPFRHITFGDNYMKQRNNILYCAALSALAFSLATPAKADIFNSTFSGTVTGNGGAFTTIGATDTFAGWTVNSGSIDWIGTYWAAPLTGNQMTTGDHSVDLDGNSPGSISTTFNTTMGQTYVVNFYLAGNPDGLPEVKTVNVSADALTPQVFTFDDIGATYANMNWTKETYSFTAGGPTTTLTFASGDVNSPYGPAIGDVSVSATPEPGFYGVMAIGLAGLGLALARRRA
jgi:choice-of-anchor C domain-containing protein